MTMRPAFLLRSLRSPVYFRRFERTLRIYDAAGNLLFSAWGYHHVDERVGGRCEKEVSEWFVGSLAMRERSDKGSGYVNTYEFTARDMIDSWITENEREQ